MSTNIIFLFFSCSLTHPPPAASTSSCSQRPSLPTMARGRPAPSHVQQAVPFPDPLLAPQFDPALLSIGNTAASSSKAIPIDPALFEIESVVNDVRKGKISLTREVIQPRTNAVGSTYALPDEANRLSGGEPISAHVLGLDDEIDPALREIVNSLTNAQQVGRFPWRDALALRFLEIVVYPSWSWPDARASCCGH